MERSTILRELASASPQIANRIEEMTSSCIQDDYDSNDTYIRLINESLGTLIDLLKDNGIVFHVSLDMIYEDGNAAEYLCFLYKYLIPEQLTSTYIDIINLPVETLTSIIDNCSDEEVIVMILDTIRSKDMGDFNMRLYRFLFDKIISTKEYIDNLKEAIIRRIRRDNRVNIKVNQKIRTFVNRMADERGQFRTQFNKIIATYGIVVDPDICKRLVSRFGLFYGDPDYLGILADFHAKVISYDDVCDVIKLIHEDSVFFVEHYDDDEISLLPAKLIIVIILAQFTDKRLFGIEPDFSRIIEFADKSIPVKNIIQMIPQDDQNIKGQECQIKQS